MADRKRLMCAQTEQFMDPTAKEHMLHLIHYHAVHDPDVHSATQSPA